MEIKGKKEVKIGNFEVVWYNTSGPVMSRAAMRAVAIQDNNKRKGGENKDISKLSMISCSSD